MNLLKRILGQKETKQTVSMDAVFDAIWWMGPEMRLVDIFVGDEGIFAVYISGTTLYRAMVEIDHEAQTVAVGEPVEIEANLRSQKAKSTISVERLSNGDTRISMLAAVAAMNRVGELDDSELFSDMARRAYETGVFPLIDFMHLGSENPFFDIGRVDAVGQEGFTYLATGTLDGNHPMTEPLTQAIEDNPGQWGISLEFYPFELDRVPVDADGDVTIKAFTRGVNTRITIAPEDMAASHLTSVQINRSTSTMDRPLTDQERQAFILAIGEDKLEELLETAQTANEVIEEEHPIHRTTEDYQGPVIELTDDDLQTVSRMVVEILGLEAESVEQIQSNNEEVTTALGQISAHLAGITERIDGVSSRLELLEQDDSERQRVWVEDLPDTARAPARVTYRPRQQRAATEDDESMAETATKTLAKLPKY